ncbi:MAG: hypothetical protein WC483_04010 [Candidatus Paceibacterota bacterium]|jgi:hypothetical protein|nr:DciA family protein [Candidatus Paceibacterota bacterium]
MFKILGEIIKKRTKSLNLDKGINEQVILSMTEDYIKQEDLFLCFPKNFINQELTIECSKAVMAEEINNQKDKIISFLKESCPDILVKDIKTIIRPN